MTAVELLTDLHRQGFSFIPLPEGKLGVRPAERLSDVLRAELKQRKGEVLPLVEAITWLRTRLTMPQHIAPLIAEWVGPLDRPTGRDVDILMQARWTLEVHAYIGIDERFWWRLPQEMVQ